MITDLENVKEKTRTSTPRVQPYSVNLPRPREFSKSWSSNKLDSKFKLKLLSSFHRPSSLRNPANGHCEWTTSANSSVATPSHLCPPLRPLRRRSSVGGRRSVQLFTSSNQLPSPLCDGIPPSFTITLLSTYRHSQAHRRSFHHSNPHSGGDCTVQHELRRPWPPHSHATSAKLHDWPGSRRCSRCCLRRGKAKEKS